MIKFACWWKWKSYVDAENENQMLMLMLTASCLLQFLNKTFRWFEEVYIKKWTYKISARFHSLTEMSRDRNGQIEVLFRPICSKPEGNWVTEPRIRWKMAPWIWKGGAPGVLTESKASAIDLTSSIVGCTANPSYSSMLKRFKKVVARSGGRYKS